MAVRDLLSRFDAAYLVRRGVVTQVRIMDRDGNSVLTGAALPPPPTIISTIAPRSYIVGSAAVTVDLATKFSGATSYSFTPASVPGVSLADGVLTIDPLQVVGPVEITVFGTNAGGSVSLKFPLTVSAAPIAAPTVVILTATSATVQADDTLPITLATVTANGDDPDLTLTAGEPHFALAGNELRLIQMPPTGAHSATVQASNEAGQASAQFALTVAAADQEPLALANTITANGAEWSGSPIITNTIGSEGATYVH